MTVAFLYHTDYLKHITDPNHPESGARLQSILQHIDPLQEQLLLVEPQPATVEMVELVHSYHLLDKVRIYAHTARPLDDETETSFDSYDVALLAAGAGPTAVDLFCGGEVQSAFAAVRPPGHHATVDTAMGLCLFNNVAITARYAQGCGFKRVLIVDFDVHHGNGTQEIFYQDGSVFYFSSHQSPAYPGTGAADEVGEGDGLGATLNFPLPAGTGDEALLPIYRERLPQVVARFEPDILLVSAGYDLHRLDPLADFQVTTEGVRGIVEAIMGCGEMPKLFLLEGGYHLEALGECVAETLKVMLADR